MDWTIPCFIRWFTISSSGSVSQLISRTIESFTFLEYFNLGDSSRDIWVLFPSWKGRGMSRGVKGSESREILSVRTCSSHFRKYFEIYFQVLFSSHLFFSLFPLEIRQIYIMVNKLSLSENRQAAREEEHRSVPDSVRHVENEWWWPSRAGDKNILVWGCNWLWRQMITKSHMKIWTSTGPKLWGLSCWRSCCYIVKIKTRNNEIKTWPVLRWRAAINNPSVGSPSCHRQLSHHRSLLNPWHIYLLDTFTSWTFLPPGHFYLLDTSTPWTLPPPEHFYPWTLPPPEHSTSWTLLPLETSSP